MADISKIKLPSGNEYNIKDDQARTDIGALNTAVASHSTSIANLNTAVASHSTEISELQQMIAGGVSFNIVWTAADYASTTAPTTAKLATIPAGVVVYFNNGANSSTGTLAASDDTIGKFYLVYSKTQTGSLDVFDEYVTVGESTKSWEKIGDTLIDLSGVVTNVTLNKQTDTVIGSNATLSVTQPTITLSSVGSQDPGAFREVIYTAVDSRLHASLSETTPPGQEVTIKEGHLIPITNYFLNYTHLQATASGGNTTWNSKDAKTVLTNVKTNNTNIKATASGGGTSWSNKDAKTVLTSVTATQSNLATSTVTGVQATTTTASKATAATTQTTATGDGNTSTTNTDWLKGISVTNEVLTIGAATMATQSTTQYTFSNVTVPIKNASATTVATGQLVTSGGGATITTNVSTSTASVIGSDATFKVTQPTVALSSGATAGTGVISVAYSAAGNGTVNVIGSSATFSNTQPSIAISSNDDGEGVEVVNGYETVSAGSALGSEATFNFNTPSIKLEYLDPTATVSANDVSVVKDIDLGQRWIAATATGGSVTWNNKDQVTALTSTTSLTVTKGQ